MICVRFTLTGLSPKPRTRSKTLTVAARLRNSPSGAAFLPVNHHRIDRTQFRSDRREPCLPARRAHDLYGGVVSATSRWRPGVDGGEWKRQDKSIANSGDAIAGGGGQPSVGERVDRGRPYRIPGATALCRSPRRRKAGHDAARDFGVLGGAARSELASRPAARRRGAGRAGARRRGRLAVPLALGRPAAAARTRPPPHGAGADMAPR